MSEPTVTLLLQDYDHLRDLNRDRFKELQEIEAALKKLYGKNVSEILAIYRDIQHQESVSGVRELMLQGKL